MQNQTIKESIKFTLFSLSAGLIQFGSFAIINELTKWSYWPTYLISVTLSVLWNFTFNRKYTFYGSNNVYKAMSLTFMFYIFFIPITTIGGNFLDIKMGWNEYLILAITMLLNFVLEFLYTKFIVYKDNEVITNDNT